MMHRCPSHGMDLTGIDLATVTVRTGRLMLRPFRPTDVDAVLRASQDPDTQRWISAIPLPYTREDARHFVEDVAPRERAEGTGLSTILEADRALGAPRVHLHTDVGNGASQAVAQRAGFSPEGIVRSCLSYRDGSRADAVLFGRLAGE